MRTVALILEAASPLEPGFHIKIDNPPYMALVIEDIQQPGPNGLASISVAHYGEQNGDLMGDPEMTFEISRTGDALLLTPYYWRNDYIGVEEYSAIEKHGRWFVIPELRERHVAFARTWDRNLRAQGFFEAFLRQRNHSPQTT
jgi:hypothetical protein